MRHNIALLLTLSFVMNVRADCPTPQSPAAWPNGLGVSYAFPANNPPPCWRGESINALGLTSDISGAFGQWTNANQSQNNSGVGFYYSNSGPFTVFVQTVVDPLGCGVSVAAQTFVAHYEGTGIVVSAQTLFYLGSESGLGFPNYDPNSANYHAFIQKLMVHEIGHSMGLANQPLGAGPCAGQVAGQSVMNAACGTNDVANNLPAAMVGLTPCDNQSLP